MRARWLTIAVSIALFVASVLALPLIPRQFFPSSDRPELLVDLSLPQNASIYASQSVAERFDAMLKTDPDVAHWSTYVGRGAIRFYLPLNVQLPNSFFSQAVIVAKDVGGARPAEGEARKGARRRLPRGRVPCLSTRTRTAGRLAGAIPGERPRHLAGSRYRAEARRRGRGRRQRPEHQFRLDGSRA